MTETTPGSHSSETGTSEATLMDKVKAEAMEWARLLVVFVPALFVFTLVLFEQRVIPSESMVPSLQVGDRVVVNKFAYGYSRHSVPWGVGRLLPLGKGRIFANMPDAGDVAVFMHPHTNRVMIKRLIGMPGDRVEVRGPDIYVNGENIRGEFLRDFRYRPKREPSERYTREYLNTVGEAEFLSHEWNGNVINGAGETFLVPEGHFFFVGDNRNYSLDSRYTEFLSTSNREALARRAKADTRNIRNSTGHCPPVNGVFSSVDCDPAENWVDSHVSIGFVPFDNLIGRAETVLWTTKRCATNPRLECSKPRVWRSL
ncbi:MAG: signal peptidase I [Pseudomonadota bacterium]